MKNIKMFMFLVGILIFGAWGMSQAETFKDNVLVHIDGLACPFCVFGVEKHLKKVNGVKKVQVNLEKGTAHLILKSGVKITEEEIQEAVTKAGFKASEITNIEEFPKNESKLDTMP